MTEQMGVYDVMHNCRAMRRLSSEPVPEAVLLKLVAAATQAASGSNKQGARWIIVRDAEQKKRIAALNRAASEDFVKVRIERAEALPHHDAARRRRMLNAVLWLAKHMHEISTLMIPCHQFEAPPTADDMCGAQSSVWPGVQNLLLAARAEGLGAVLTTYGLSDYEAFAEVLALPKDLGAFAVIPVGYPLGNFGPVTRLPVDQVTRFDRWS
ncbi:MAG: nitroreductase family protein [Alphaproteobacteria bacterium]